MSSRSKTFALVLVTLFLMSSVGLPSITSGETTWNTQIVDTHGSNGKLVIDSNDAPHIVYNTYSMLEDGVTYGLSYTMV